VIEAGMTSAQPVGYLVPEFPSQTHTFFWREIGALEDAGVPVHVMSTSRPALQSCPHDFAEEARARTHYLFPPRPGSVAELLRRPVKSARAIGYILGLRETPVLRRLKLLALVPTAMGMVRLACAAGFDHVHIHSCANAAHLGALAYLLGGVDYSLTLHGDLPVYGTDHRAKFRYARFVSAVTRPLQKSLEDQIGGGRPYPLIWMGVDTERFRPAPQRDSRDPAAPLRVLTVARLNPTKGHVFFLRAMARLREKGIEIHYRIAGDGPARDAIETEIAALDLEDRVTLLGSVSEDRVIALLQESDVAALTSFGLGEAAPVSVMEAMACGVTCIVSIIGGTPDMITHAHDGLLVPQKDVAAIADVLETLAREPDGLTRMSARARATAEASFDHRTNALKLHAAITGTGAGGS
jgi:colanic acid/amylovoran biosynthesis glycosyltransferase